MYERGTLSSYVHTMVQGVGPLPKHSGAFQSVLAITEVILRNAIDRQLRIWNAAQPVRGGSGLHSADWLVDPATPLNSLTRGARRRAADNAREAEAARANAHPRKGARITHDDLVAQLTFGVWAKLLPTPDVGDRNYTARRILWEQAVRHAFPHARDDPDGWIVADRARRLHTLRNRVSHMEPLLDVQAIPRQSDALRLLGAIDPAARDWCAGISRIRAVNSRRPTVA